MNASTPPSTPLHLSYAAGRLPELRIDALAQEALAAKGVESAQLLAALCSLDPSNGDWPALLLKSLAEDGRMELADAFAQAALRRFPLHTALRIQYWAMCEALPPSQRVAIVREWLPHVVTGKELKALLRLLPEFTNSAVTDAFCWGVVEYHAPSQELRGWALNLRQPGVAAVLKVEAPQGTATIRASHPHPLLAEAGLATACGGFRARLPGALQEVHVRFEHGPELLGSPLVAMDGVRAGYTGFGEDSPVAIGRPWQAGLPAEAAHPPSEPVDILIPVYKGYQATLDCVQSVLQAQPLNRSVHHIVVLDDASPEPHLASALQALAAQGRIQYLRHEGNLGFIRNMNRGMALHPERDVVWLNADTRVHGNWLDRLQAAAYANASTASATPLSNNGELMSFPEPRRAAPMPGAAALARLDSIAAELNHPPAWLPMGCGFCFYVKRAALNAVGLLDEVHLRRGYGEESDWCLRARQAGWQHVGAPNVFVGHAGGASFGKEKMLRAAQNNAVLRTRFPYAERDYQNFLARDPLADMRKEFTARLAQAGLNVDGTPQRKPLAAKKTARTGVKPLTLKRLPRLQQACPAWVVLDTPAEPSTGAQWLPVARQLAKQHLAGGATTRLLVLQESVWQPQWQATGQVFKLAELLGLHLKDRLSIWGAGAAVSLAAKPNPMLLELAQSLPLPVYAPATPEWRGAGAWPLDTLPGFPVKVWRASQQTEVRTLS